MQLTNNYSQSIKFLKSSRKRFPGLFKLPSSSDYSTILKKLDLVISNAKYSQNLLILTKSSPLNIFLEKGQSQLIHIHPTGQPIPLHITYKRNYGKLKTYISTKISEPCQELHDQVTKSDIIEISDRDQIFHIKRVAVSVFCLSECNVIVSLNYGAEILKKVENLRSAKSTTKIKGTCEEDSLDLIINQEKLNQQKRTKTRGTSFTNFKEFGEKGLLKIEAIKEKREAVYYRSKVLKSSRRFRSLTERPLMNKSRRGKSRGMLSYKKVVVSGLIKLLCIYSASAVWYRKMKKLKAKKSQELIFLRKINTFKSIYKAWSTRRGKLTTLETCRLNLIFFRDHQKALCHKDFSQKVKKLFFSIKTLLISKSSFDTYLKSSICYLVCLIQHEWKRYKLIKLFRLNRLEKIWKSSFKALPKNRQKPSSIPSKALKSLLEVFYHNYLQSLPLFSTSSFSFDSLFSPALLIPFLSSQKI